MNRKHPTMFSSHRARFAARLNPAAVRRAWSISSAGLLVCLMLCCCSCARFFGAGGAGAARPEAWLPAEVSAAICVPDVEKARERWKLTRAGQAWDSPETEFWRSSQFDPALQAVLERWGFKDAVGVLDLVKGQAVLALDVRGVPDFGDSRAPVWLIQYCAALDFGANAVEARKRVETLGTGRGFKAWDGGTLLLAGTQEYLDGILARRAGRVPETTLLLGKDTGPLASAGAWKKAEGYLAGSPDSWMYVNAAGLYDVLTAGGGRLAKARGAESDWKRVKALLAFAGLDAFDVVMTTVKMREDGFLTRSALHTRKQSRGFLLPPSEAPAMITPEWMPSDCNSFTALRIQPPAEIKRAFATALSTDNLMLGAYLKVLEGLFAAKAGISLDALLGGLGSEVCIASFPSQGSPNAVALWEMRDAASVRAALKAAVLAADGVTTRCAFLGYPYEEHRLPAVASTPIFTAELDGFLMLGTSAGWLHEFLKQRQILADAKRGHANEALLGGMSLMPEFKARLGRAPQDAVVSGYSFSRPAEGLKELNLMLPQLAPALGDMFRGGFGPDFGARLQKAIPPLTPFSEKSFPGVSRDYYREGVVVTESWASLDPLNSPLLAAVFCAVGKDFLAGK